MQSTSSIWMRDAKQVRFSPGRDADEASGSLKRAAADVLPTPYDTRPGYRKSCCVSVKRDKVRRAGLDTAKRIC